jgi:hypothetical protein
MRAFFIRWSQILGIATILAVLLFGTVVTAKEPDPKPKDPIELTCTVAGSKDHKLKYVLHPGKKTGQDDALRLTLPLDAWVALNNLKSSDDPDDKENYQKIVDSLCDNVKKPTPMPTASSTPLPGGTTTALPSVTPSGEDPNPNKPCKWVADSLNGHWECGGVPANPKPKDTATPGASNATAVVNTPLPVATNAPPATALPKATKDSTEDAVVITDGELIPGNSEGSTAAEVGNKEYVCNGVKPNGEPKCSWVPVQD